MQFRALTDLYLNDGSYIQAGQTFTAPANYPPPTNAVQPLDPDATQALWNVGPKGMLDAQPYQAQFTNGARWSDIPVPPATIYWVPVNVKNPGLGFVLTGGGSNLGPKPPM
jgi:hypothetical protein